jgi:hypothetical protein
MRLSGDAYSERLESFSHFTLVLIAMVDGMNREVVYKGQDITTDSELTEEQVIENLLELINSNPKALQPISYEDALEIVCGALEQGYYTSLYEILDSNVTLVLVDEDERVYGIRDVINFLVQKGLDHNYITTEDTTCDILTVAEGNRYGVGEKCILLIYHLKNGKKEYHVIKVHFSNGVINKLELFRPYGPLRLVAEE